MTFGVVAAVVGITAVLYAITALVNWVLDWRIKQQPRALEQVRAIEQGRSVHEADNFFRGSYRCSTAMAAARIPTQENEAAAQTRPAS